MTIPPASTLLNEMGERRIIRELIEPRYDGVGDDCAAFGRDQVITTDSCGTALVAGMGMDDPAHTGWLLATINLSDLAAAGAEPEGLVVNYSLPPDTPVDTLKRIMDGVDACATEHGTRVLGGDIGEGRELRLSATAVGRCPRRITAHGPVGTRLSRRGARVGDHLLLIGSPGYLWGAALLHHGFATLPDEDRDVVYERACRPRAQLRAGRALAAKGLARAAIDVSDGLFAAVRGLCAANGLGADVRPHLDLDPVLDEVCRDAGVDPFQLGQTWGDWCLLVAVRPREVDLVRRLLPGRDPGVRDLGVLTAAPDRIRLVDGTAEPRLWDGIDQERFSSTSWRGDGVVAALDHMRELSGV
ncbi:thiamine-phosphate kinase [Pseudonocardia lacus]|uniref:thiamine-phosphate kinase n=1 Tax=Pseudonocardia lacus TaxID=2835865 RepID=UPI00202937AE|nr:thiamine-phosphate kinase [Pseudonocardia lacus]